MRRSVPEAWDVGKHVLCLEGEVFRSDDVRGEASEDARGRERQAESTARRADAQNSSNQGTAGKKVVAPAVKRKAVAHLKALFGLSERRACQIAGADQKMA